ncbi:hypothetical protein DLD82_08930 [Methanospirillum stamsii]|uniref:Uncharacterized protein n=1 Tax=Methanospirillum stamsii TaxID=1277351 RepID=A0A2V2N438_9EURY|nr:hypothetical protein DLD82_08930 [Methanospirillum stamsii]
MQRVSPIQANFGKTVYLITFINADKNVILENGMVKKRGKPEKLKSTNGTFVDIDRRQMKTAPGDVVV